jgi:alkyl sulfatase BDS1-like metallo-beta-lactamase superfamily hydrolase
MNAHRHFHELGQMPSEHTIAAHRATTSSLPFDDVRDFEEARRGFIAAPAERRILGASGNVVWDIGAYDFLLDGQTFESIHPSLQRQAVLNMEYGLYEVLPDRIYQVRGFDLANITFVKGVTGWIVFDPLTMVETSAAALALVDEHLGKRPVVAVVYSHSHLDHWGGVGGVIDRDAVVAGTAQVIAPVGFLEHAVAENVYAGNAMNRRLVYQYGTLLDRSRSATSTRPSARASPTAHPA